MGFKTGLVVGTGIGYMLGSKTGRERYERAVVMLDRAAESPAIAVAAAATERPRQEAKRLISNGIRNVSEMIRSRANQGRETSSGPF